jgi:hypothetical protein
MINVASSMIFFFRVRRATQFLLVLAFRRRLVLFLFSLSFEFQEIIESLLKRRSKKRLSLSSLLKTTRTNSSTRMTKNFSIALNVVICSRHVVVLLTLRVLVVRDRSKRAYRYVFDSLFRKISFSNYIRFQFDLKKLRSNWRTSKQRFATRSFQSKFLLMSASYFDRFLSRENESNSIERMSMMLTRNS